MMRASLSTGLAGGPTSRSLPGSGGEGRGLLALTKAEREGSERRGAVCEEAAVRRGGGEEARDESF